MSNTTPSESGSSTLSLGTPLRSRPESDTESLDDGRFATQVDLSWSLPGIADQIFYAAWALTLSRSYEVDDVAFTIPSNASSPDTKHARSSKLTVTVQGEDSIETFISNVALSTEPAQSLNAEISAAIESSSKIPHSALHVPSQSEECEANESGPEADVTIHLDSDKITLVARPGTLRGMDRQGQLLLSRFKAAISQLQTLDHASKVEEISLQTDFEKQAILDIYGPLPEPVEECVHHLIARHAEIDPQAKAVSAWDMELTYTELDVLSTKVALHLVDAGVRVDDKVALCFEKSAWAIVAMLAIIKAGGAPFALSTANTPERTKTMMDQTQARIILTDPQHVTPLQAFAPKVIVVDSCFVQNLPSLPRTLPEVASSDVAYIIFTSGSTGQPKAIVTEHGALCSSLRAHGQRFMIRPGTRVFNFAAYTFDISIADILFTLALGATVCVPSESERMDDLAGAITKYRANWAFLTPTVTETLDPASVPTLRTIFWSGEASTSALVQKWSDELDAIVSYGPAEASVHCAGSRPKRTQSDHQNVGQSLGCRMWIMDRNNLDQQALAGTTGEIVIEGRIIARGYLDAVKTEQAFVWTSACTSEPIRVYKTGDMGRLNLDGTVSVVGRVDSQVKIRGQRVELGEIEQQFHKSLPNVDTAVAWASSADKIRHALVVFFTLSTNVEADAHDPRLLMADQALLGLLSAAQQRLRDYLPSYMVPSLFVPLTRVPLTSHGKTDRRALTDIVAALSDENLRMFSLMQEGKVAKRQPQTEMEASLHQLLLEQLGIPDDSVGVEDDFFRLGGNSLTAIKMCAAARARDIPLTVAIITEHLTVKQMAKAISGNATSTQQPSGLPIPPQPFELLNGCEAKEACKIAAQRCQTSETNVQDIFPCTAMQQSMFLQSLKDPGSYVVQYRWDLPKMIDLDRFKRAWKTVYATCDILRTRLVEGQGGPLWQVVLQDDMPWNSATLTNPGMDLGAPLCRFSLLADEHRFLLDAHHAIIDGWTLSLLLDKFEAAYEGSDPIPAPQFNQFIRYLLNDDSGESADFWMAQLDDFERVSNPMAPGGGQLRHVVRAQARINSQALAFTATDYLRAAWAIVMSEYEDRDDIVLGAVESCRDSAMPGIERVLGPTLATVPVRIQVTKSQPTLELMQATRHQRAAMMPHRHLGLANIADLSPGAREACDLTNLIVVQPPISTEHGSRVLTHTQMAADVQLLDCALVLECNLETSGVAMNLDHDASALSEADAQRLLDRLGSVFEQLQAASPATCIADLDVISPSDMAKIKHWNEDLPEQVDSCIHDLFAAQAVKSPKAQAVDAWDGSYDFAQLDRDSHTLASYLSSLGVAAGHRVPVCFEKSKWFPVSILAVLKTGAAFIPLDALLPVQRLREILDMVQAKHCLVSPETRKLLPDGDCTVINVPELMASSIATSQTLKGIASSQSRHSSSLGYCVFTSGSTGKPKGVMVSHSSFSSGALARAPLIHRTPASRVFAFSSHSFDTAVEDVLTSLLVGACICIPSEDERKNDLSGAMSKYRANTFDTTPSIVTMVNPASVPGISTLILGGEAVTTENVALWSSQTTLINTYGPCECAIVSTLSHLESSAAVSSNIGRGVGCLTWVVDENDHDRLVPIGAVGELLIEGPIVGDGYIDNEEQTKAAFLESTRWRSLFNYSRSWRMYKTGDLVRYASDGSLLFLGRKDSQVKIRGQRVEPGEIEDKLREVLHDEDVKVVVETVKLPKRSPMVVAFLGNAINHAQQTLELLNASLLPSDLNKVAADLSAKIPSYMMPTFYVRLGAFPRTSTEKVDRKSLKALFESLVKETAKNEELPETQAQDQPKHFAEITLQALWARILKISPRQIGVYDSFFALGGDSIGAMQLVAACEQCCLPLMVTDVFKAPGLEAMASQIVSRMQRSVPIETNGIPKPSRFSTIHPGLVDTMLDKLSTNYGIASRSVQDMYPCSPLQSAFMRGTLQSPGSYIATHIFEAGSEITIEQLRSAWGTVVKHVDVLRTRIVETDAGDMLQVVLDEQTPWSSATESLEECLNDAANMEIGFGSSLSRFSLVEQPSLSLVWTAHHSVYDGWTLDLVKNALETACNGRTPDTVSYRDFIQHITGVNGTAAAEFWKHRLTSPPEVAHLASQTPISGARQEDTLSSTIELSMPPNAGLLSSTYVNAAWALTISQYLETEDVIFGSVSAGRNLAIDNILKIVGPTMTTFPMRIMLEQNESVQQLLDRVQSGSTDAMQFEQLGIQKIRELSEDCNQACQFETLLDIHPADDESESQAIKVESSRAQNAAFHTHPLVVTCRPGRSTTFVEFVYDSSTIEPDLAQRLLQQFQHLLQQLAQCVQKGSSDAKIADLELISPADKEQLLSWNSAEFIEIDECIHDRFHSQALLFPDKIAVQGWDASFTYRELDDLTTRLASYLVRLGVGDKPIIPLCFTKSAWTVVAQLAALKIGGCYVALDASHPHDRLQVMVEQTRAQTVILAEQFKPVFETRVKNVVVLDDAFRDKLLRQPIETSLPAGIPSSPAFICFTSGSTGLPKGVVLQHDGFCTLAAYVGQEMNFSSDTRALQFAAYAFDVSNAETFLTLIHGGTLFIASDYDRMNDLPGILKRWPINWLFLTPTFAGATAAEDLEGVKTFTMGGEAPRQDLIDRFAHRVKLINAYGPAEGTIWPSICRFYPDSDCKNVGVSGSGCHMWLTNPKNHSQLVPMGVTGEIILEGPMVGPGYLFDEVKTKAAFIDPPAWAVPRGDKPQKFYKVGDLAVQRPDGSLSFIGRKDNQVKLRGQRLELGEVEHRVLDASDAVISAAAEIVSVQQGDSQVQALATFLRMSDDTRISFTNDMANTSPVLLGKLTAIRDSLKCHLPSYMVPTYYIPMQRFPTTASLKLDRKKMRQMFERLPKADQLLYSFNSSSKRMPRSPREIQVCSIWAEVLHTPQSDIGIDDSPLQLGADSMAAIKASGLARKQGLVMPVAAIMQSTSLANLCAATTEVEGTDVAGATYRPFALLPEAKLSDLESLKKNIAQQCRVDDAQIADAYPLTKLQEGIMMLSQKEPGSYVSQFYLKLDDSIDIERFKSAWQQVVRQCDILRTRVIFAESHGLLQVVVNDNSNWEQQDDLDVYLQDDRKQPFEQGDPLFRYTVVKKPGDAECHFVCTAHHAVYDGWTMQRLPELLQDAYRDGILTQHPPFSAFVKHAVGVDYQAASEFWSEQLRGFTTPDFSFVRANTHDHQGTAHVTHEMASSGSSRTAATQAVLIQAAWGILLGQYSNSQDITYGLTVNGRDPAIPSILDICGPTISTVPKRIKFDNSQAVDVLLQAIQGQSIASMPYDQYGLQMIQKCSDDTRAACSFETLLLIEALDKQSTAAEAGWHFDAVSSVGSANSFHACPFVLSATMIEETTHLEAEFDTGKVSRACAVKLLQQLEHIILQLEAASAATKIGDLDLLTADEYRTLEHWNRDVVAVSNPKDLLVHSHIKRHAQQQPHAEAVFSSELTLTYEEFDRATDRLAVHLQTLGVGPESFVPICMEKSAYAIVAMVGIIKAGAGFVPIDAKHPATRLQEILHQIAATLVLVSPDTRSVMEQFQVECVEISADRLAEMAKYDVVPIANCQPENSLYIIYTSGSTGKPKGVVTEHGAFCTGVLARADAQQRGPESRVLQFASYTFDMSIEDILATLMRRGTVCVPTEYQRINALGPFMTDARVNTAHLTPSTLSTINADEVPTLETLLLLGESMTGENVKIWADRVDLINTYGPSEASVVSTVTKQVITDADPANIGKGYGCLTWIVDPRCHDKLAAIGSIGELLLEGPILARHYLKQPEKTDSVFVTDPAWAVSKSGKARRFYKTGDLVKYSLDGDGTIVFVGRKDTQIKLRGSRIELGEIETRLQELLPGEELAVDVVQAGGQEKKELAAFVVVKAQDESAHTNTPDYMTQQLHQMTVRIKDKLASVLPAVMIPTLWLPIHAMPLSTSGKRDRKALQGFARDIKTKPAIASDSTATPVAKGRAPRGQEELLLCELWSKVLSIDPATVDIDDDFMTVGGDSILAMKLAALARTRGLSLTVANIFTHSIFRDMARYCLQRSNVETDRDVAVDIRNVLDPALNTFVSEKTAIPPADVANVMPATDFQRWCITTDQMASRGWSNYWEMEFTKPLDKFRFMSAFKQLAERHAILRTAFVFREHELLQVVRSRPVIDHVHFESDKEYHCWSENDMHSIAKSVLPTGGLRLATCGSSDGMVSRAVITLSHSRFDALSLSSMCDDLVAAYDGKELSARPEFSRFVEHISDKVQQRGDEHFWREQLHRSEMTAIVARPAGHCYQFPVRKTHVQPIKLPSNKQPFTFATTLKTAWAITLADHCQTTDVVFGHLVSGRTAPVDGIDQIVGPCINLIPVRVRLNGVQTHRDLLASVQQQHIAAMPHENLGFDTIIEKCTHWPRSSRFSSIVQHQNVHEVDQISFANCSSQATVNLRCPPHDSTDVWIISLPKDDHIDITLSCNDSLIPDAIAQHLLQTLVGNVQTLLSSNLTTGITTFLSAEEKRTDQQLLNKVKGIWSRVLKPSRVIDSTTRYFDLRGDTSTPLLLQECYRAHFERSLPVESIIDRPTLREHVDMLLSQKIDVVDSESSS